MYGDKILKLHQKSKQDDTAGHCKRAEGRTVGPFKYFVMNNKAFHNLFCNPQKSFHTSPNNRGCQSFFQLNNSIYKKIYI